jgi:tetratricopeptide (TPR) repeat protein
MSSACRNRGAKIQAVAFTLRCATTALLALLACLPIAAVDEQSQNLDRRFQTAVAQYDAGKFAEAAVQLEALLPDVPESFEVHELLGLVYSAQSQDAKATPHLEKAVRLKPDSAAARGNFATSLMRVGKSSLAEHEFKKAVELEPANYDANHNLGEFYIQAGKISDATSFLEAARRINRAAYDNGYDLSLAYLQTGRFKDARQLVQDLLKQKDTAELHNLLGQIEEKDGQFVTAANEFQIAAHSDPSESNLFDWASELLLHRTLDPAIEVFQKAAERFPDSHRLAIGLGIALYSRGNYEAAVKSLLKAADLAPSDPSCYHFLSKAYDSSPAQAEDVIQRFDRFAKLQPNNARASYYYAMSLWKGRRAQDAGMNLQQIESLLKTAAELDPKFAEAYLQLGNLYSDQTKYADAVPEYQKALSYNADLADAHYRLGQAYVHIGDKVHAQEQLEIYQKLRAQHLAEVDEQRAEVRQFVYSSKDGASAKP